MSWLRITMYCAVCDVPGCEESEDFLPRHGDYIAGARKMAKREGWTVDADDVMRCPKHRASLPA